MAASQLIPLPSGGSTKDSSDDIRVMSDENLVAVAKNGRRLAFDELHNRHGRKMFRVAHRIARNREDAEDAVQECFLNAFVHLESFDRRSKFLTWLTRIATNAALMKRRKNRASREVPVKGPAEAPDFLIEDALADSLSNPEERLAKSERETILRDAIAKLRPSLRKVIEVYQLQESPYLKPPRSSGSLLQRRKRECFTPGPRYAGQQSCNSSVRRLQEMFIFKSPRDTTSTDPASTLRVAHLRGHSLRSMADPRGSCC